MKLLGHFPVERWAIDSDVDGRWLALTMQPGGVVTRPHYLKLSEQISPIFSSIKQLFILGEIISQNL